MKRWNAEIQRGKRVGPRIYMSGPAVDGPKDAKYRVIVNTAEDGRRAVDALAELGVDFIHTHNAVPRDAYFGVLPRARERGLRVASHLPRGVTAWEVADAGVGSIEHGAESLLASPIYAGYAADAEAALAWWDSPQGDGAIDRLARTGVAVTPTLVAYAEMSERRRGTPAYEGRLRVLEFLLRLAGRLHTAGVPILAGSDLFYRTLPMRPGKSLPDEIELLQRAGLSSEQAHKAAGENILRWLRAKPSRLPRVESGDSSRQSSFPGGA